MPLGLAHVALEQFIVQDKRLMVTVSMYPLSWGAAKLELYVARDK